MRDVLIVDNDDLVCEVIIAILQEWQGTIVDCTQEGIVGAQKLRERQFDLALIDGSLAGPSGMQLAEIAANENTPSLLLSGHPDVNGTLEAFGYPHLAKPFSPNQLLARSREVVSQARENVRRVKESAVRMQAALEAADATMAYSGKLISRLNKPLRPR